jgi:DNA-binding GntR family transcriptional regulator
VVTEFTAEKADELYSVRLLIEPALAPSIVSNCTNFGKRLLRTVVDQTDAEKGANDQVWRTPPLRDQRRGCEVSGPPPAGATRIAEREGQR